MAVSQMELNRFRVGKNHFEEKVNSGPNSFFPSSLIVFCDLEGLLFVEPEDESFREGLRRPHLENCKTSPFYFIFLFTDLFIYFLYLSLHGVRQCGKTRANN